MEDLNTASKRLILSSAGLILLLGGWASFSEDIPVGITGMKVTSIYIAPWVLVFFWLYSWQRFYVLSQHNNKKEIDNIISREINKSANHIADKIVRSVFPPSNFNLQSPVAVRKWGWRDAKIPLDAPADFIYYERCFLKRNFMFSYIGNDLNNQALHVHFGPQANNIKNGTFSFFSCKFWKCVAFEIKIIAPLSFKLPIIGFHYFPHIFSWGTTLYSFLWLYRYFTSIA